MTVTYEAKPLLRDGQPIKAGDLRPGQTYDVIPVPKGYEVKERVNRAKRRSKRLDATRKT